MDKKKLGIILVMAFIISAISIVTVGCGAKTTKLPATTPKISIPSTIYKTNTAQNSPIITKPFVTRTKLKPIASPWPTMSTAIARALKPTASLTTSKPTTSATTPAATPTATPVLTALAVSQDKISLAVNASHQLKFTAAYTSGTGKDVTTLSTYTSSDNKIATVTAGGLVKGIAAGSASITASYSEGAVTKTLTVYVTVK